MTKENEMWVIERYHDDWYYTEHGCYTTKEAAKNMLRHVKNTAAYAFNKPKYRIVKWIRKEVSDE